jgi:hypothetical protein
MGHALSEGANDILNNILLVTMAKKIAQLLNNYLELSNYLGKSCSIGPKRDALFLSQNS